MAMPEPRNWQGMKDMAARLLKERTGEDVAAWNQRIEQEGFNRLMTKTVEGLSHKAYFKNCPLTSS
jgi:hypothetical protein